MRELHHLDPTGDRMSRVIRDTLDQLLDGRRSGRWDYTQLHKTEKTHMGTLVEINLHREFRFDDGDDTDFSIVGVQTDCKFSRVIGGWEIGPEIVGHLCLVVWASDLESRWQAGMVRATDERLRDTRNRDAKRKLSTAGVAAIRWLWPKHGRLATNLLLHLDPDVRGRIMSAQGGRGRHGQARLFELCRQVQGVVLRRAVIETVGWGLDDPLKRMRSNGGARDALRPEGILVLGHQDQDPAIAEALGLVRPGKGEFIAVRVVPRATDDGRPSVEISDRAWVIARSDEPVVEAPVVSRAARVAVD